MVGLLAGCARQAALKVSDAFLICVYQVMFPASKDGRISCGENCGLCVLSVLSGILGIVAVAMLIWVSYTYFKEGMFNMINKIFNSETKLRYTLVFD